MKMYLNFNNQWKSGVFAAVPADIHDVVEIVLPAGFNEIEMQDGSKAIEWADGQVTRASEILTEHKGTTAIPYIVDCRGSAPKNVYLKAKNCKEE